MKQKHRIVLETLCLLALLAFSFVFLRDEFGLLFHTHEDAGEASVAGGQEESDESWLFEVPSVELDDGDSVVPENWNEDILSRLNYDLLDDERLFDADAGELSDRQRETLRLFYEKRYDDLIKLSKERLSKNFSQQSPDDFTRVQGIAEEFEEDLHVWALASELRGYLRDATRLYPSIYPKGKTLNWALNRLSDIVGKSNHPQKSALVLMNMGIYEFACDNARRPGLSASFDETFDYLVEKTTGAGEYNAENITSIPLSSDDPHYATAFQMYQLRDRCAKIANPSLHYACNGDRRQLVFLTRKSYSVFLKSLEEYLNQKKRLQGDETHDSSTPSSESNTTTDVNSSPNALTDKDKAFEIFFRLGELPY